MTPLEQVREYHQTAGLSLDESFCGSSTSLNQLRQDLLQEEAFEAIEANYPEALLKELADVLYVTYGWAATFGWDLDEAFRRVHQNNMGRMYQDDGTIKRREDGKIMKNKNFPKVELGDLT